MRLLPPLRLLVALLATGALLAAPAQAGAKARAACTGTDVAPSAENLDAVRATILCLHNRERVARGLAPLRENPRLRRAADGHSVEMVVTRQFEHGDFAGRILRTRYGRGQAWAMGENIAWGTGILATAGEIQRAWMASPPHRANILRRQFREIGIGIALGAPVPDTGGLPGATYTADFGARR
jgi:uncharacterized protein YkwD